MSTRVWRLGALATVGSCLGYTAATNWAVFVGAVGGGFVVVGMGYLVVGVVHVHSRKDAS